MEEMNRQLAEKLEETNRAHDEQMRALLDRVGELSNRTNPAPATVVIGGDDAGDEEPLPDAGGLADVATPVPDYTEGHFFPYMPAPGYPRLEHLQRQEVAADRQLRPRLPVPDRRRGVSAPSPS